MLGVPPVPFLMTIPVPGDNSLPWPGGLERGGDDPHYPPPAQGAPALPAPAPQEGGGSSAPRKGDTGESPQLSPFQDMTGGRSILLLPILELRSHSRIVAGLG